MAKSLREMTVAARASRVTRPITGIWPSGTRGTPLRPTRAHVDLEAIAANYRALSEAAGPAKIMAVVKADAYGHGLVAVARRLSAEGAVWFGVALAEEALELRAEGITGELLVLNGVYGGAHREVLRAGLTPVVYDIADVEAFANASDGEPFSIHLKVDTGMSRLGVTLRDLPAWLARVAQFSTLRVVGLMTHLHSADSDPEATLEQLRRFAVARTLVCAAGHTPSTFHVGNSAFMLNSAFDRAAVEALVQPFTMVRPGLALYGWQPGATSPKPVALKPALKWRTEVIAVRDLAEGDSIGYGATYKAARPMRVATLPVGYADGLMRALSNRGAVLLGGVRRPIVGRVSMDLTTIDISGTAFGPGEEAVLVGAQGDALLTPDEVAAAAGTISYEVLTAISRRVPRVYM